MDNSIHIDHISKSYGKVQALERLSFDVSAGELFGLIGPDGAGKTTLFRILTTLLLADQGAATVCGLDVLKQYRQIRQRVGYMPGRFSLYPDLSVEENLTFFATLFHTSIRQNYELIKEIYERLEPFKNRRANDLSGGMKQKLALCCALIHRPDVLFLDEPTTGVDPVSRVEFWDMLERLRDQGITILVSTPYMDEASRCNRIALMRQGECLSLDTPEAIRRSYAHALLAVRASSMYPLLHVLRQYPAVFSAFSFGDVHHVALSNPFTNAVEEAQFCTQLVQYLTEKGFEDVTVQPILPSIEDCFMAYEQTEKNN